MDNHFSIQRRYRPSGISIPTAYIHCDIPALGYTADQEVAQIYLNDDGQRGETAARNYVARSFLTTLNEAARVEALGNEPGAGRHRFVVIGPSGDIQAWYPVDVSSVETARDAAQSWVEHVNKYATVEERDKP